MGRCSGMMPSLRCSRHCGDGGLVGKRHLPPCGPLNLLKSRENVNNERCLGKRTEKEQYTMLQDVRPPTPPRVFANFAQRISSSATYRSCLYHGSACHTCIRIRFTNSPQTITSSSAIQILQAPRRCCTRAGDLNPRLPRCR